MFSETLTEEFKQKHKIRKASVVMINCEIYSSSVEDLNFCKSLLTDTAIIVFDDWNTSNLAHKNLGEKRAFDKFLQQNPHFKAEEFEQYSFGDYPEGKLFVLTNTQARS